MRLKFKTEPPLYRSKRIFWFHLTHTILKMGIVHHQVETRLPASFGCRARIATYRRTSFFGACFLFYLELDFFLPDPTSDTWLIPREEAGLANEL